MLHPVLKIRFGRSGQQLGNTRFRPCSGVKPLTLLLADTDTAGTFWQQDTSAGPVLERGPELVRIATVRGAVLALTGDTKDAADLEVWAPPGLHAVL